MRYMVSVVPARGLNFYFHSSGHDDGKARESDLWKVVSINYEVNGDHPIKEFKFMMDIECWKLLCQNRTTFR